MGTMRLIMKHPFKMLGLMNRKNVRVFFSMARQFGFRTAFSNMRRVVGSSASDADRMSSFERYSVREFDGSVTEVPAPPDPLVSIIIPVYNQFEYTVYCVRSIVSNTEGIGFEVIIADDCSTDMTRQILEYLPGIRLVRTERNQGFIRNCNNAAKVAEGRYLVFLNNDTLVKEGWLSALVDTMEDDPSVGLAGSKLIYPDGHLQEAGCIVWGDGTIWNYGRGMNPRLPEYNYLKDTDYVSGASFIIRRDLWERLGGFDEYYLPAYCEDTDLSFRVRKEGLRTVYQPRSEVVHFEGVSNGKSTQSGLKAYQVTNMQKLFDRWKDDLAGRPPQGVDVFRARDCSFGKKIVAR